MPPAAHGGGGGGGGTAIDIENGQYGSVRPADYSSLTKKKNNDSPAEWGQHELGLVGRVGPEAWDRGRWLVGLMLMQSTSSWILAKYTTLLEEHMIIISFLTMLVGAGGNAGAQAAVASVRGIALGRPEYGSVSRVLPVSRATEEMVQPLPYPLQNLISLVALSHTRTRWCSRCCCRRRWAASRGCGSAGYTAATTGRRWPSRCRAC